MTRVGNRTVSLGEESDRRLRSVDQYYRSLDPLSSVPV